MVTQASCLIRRAGFLACECKTNREARCMSNRTGWKPVLLVPKVPHAGEDHCHLALVSGGNHFFVTNRAAWLNSAGCASFGRSEQPVRERKESVARDRAAF